MCARPATYREVTPHPPQPVWRGEPHGECVVRGALGASDGLARGEHEQRPLRRCNRYAVDSAHVVRRQHRRFAKDARRESVILPRMDGKNFDQPLMEPGNTPERSPTAPGHYGPVADFEQRNPELLSPTVRSTDNDVDAIASDEDVLSRPSLAEHGSCTTD